MQPICEGTNTKSEQPSNTKQATLVMFMSKKNRYIAKHNYPTEW